MGQSDTGSNEYEDSSDEYTNEGTAIVIISYYITYLSLITVTVEKKIILLFAFLFRR